MTDIPLRVAVQVEDRYRRLLRRFQWKADSTCTVSEWGCDATADLGDIPAGEREEVHGDNWPHDDPRWPAACARCGGPFRATDQWQRNDERIFCLPDGTEFLARGGFTTAPAGTIVRASWYDDRNDHPDRVEPWLIVLPDGGTWITCTKATDGQYWQVTGTAPDLTVTPSIFHRPPSGWHGWIRNGNLVGA